MNEIDLTSCPALVPHARLEIDRISGEPVVLYPEGILELNGTAYAILRLCDGLATVEAILTRLAEEFEAEPAELRGDVLACLRDLQQRSLIRL